MTWVWLYVLAGLATCAAVGRMSPNWRRSIAEDGEVWLLVGTFAAWPVVWWFVAAAAWQLIRNRGRFDDGRTWRDVYRDNQRRR